MPNGGDSEESEATATDSGNDSATGGTSVETEAARTSVASVNIGSASGDDGTNTGLDDEIEPSVDVTNSDRATSVQPSNSMYYQSLTTTTTEGQDDFQASVTVGANGGPGPIPDGSRSEAHVTKLFEEANDRVSTPAERRLLRQLADSFEPAASEVGQSGWDWLGFAIDDAVAAGSAFVAPRRLREILNRWSRDGAPAEYAPSERLVAGPSLTTPGSVTGNGGGSHRAGRPWPAQDRPVRSGAAHLVGEGLVPARDGADPADPGIVAPAQRSASPAHDEEPFVAPVFTVPGCGMTNRQVWSAALGELQLSGAIGRAEVSTWLRDAAVVGMTDAGALVLGVPHELARRRAGGRYLGAIRQAVERVTGLALAIEVVLYREWAA